VVANSFFVETDLAGTGGGGHEIVCRVNAFPFWAFQECGEPKSQTQTGEGGLLRSRFLGSWEMRSWVVTVGKPLVYSPVITETLAVRLSFHVRRTRRTMCASLILSPRRTLAQVGFQLLAPGKSINEGGTVVRPGTATVSKFSGRMRLRHRGLYRALIKVSDGGHVSNYSEPILVR
jgi:hypothetical protein